MKQVTFRLLAVLLLTMGCLTGNAQNYDNFKVSSYIRAQDVLRMKDKAFLEKTWETVSSQVELDKMYIETHRDSIVVDEKTLKEEGWLPVRNVNWHMIYRNKRLDDNGPMGASLVVMNRRHPNKAFEEYIAATDKHIRESEPRLADGTIARLWPHENTVWADDAYMALSFLVNMGEATGDNSYFTDAANQILN